MSCEEKQKEEQVMGDLDAEVVPLNSSGEQYRKAPLGSKEPQKNNQSQPSLGRWVCHKSKSGAKREWFSKCLKNGETTNMCLYCFEMDLFGYSCGFSRECAGLILDKRDLSIRDDYSPFRK